ncbi:acyl-CoA dehydrogenase family protein [Pseudofrankia sp. BMG5.37]|uniref:acyl-CoA dehydrogenase family protein n=1 Tax=Pseudofrankia sp. BMG5.37 TaxID=3050035 RepID=UPI0037C67CD5
MAEGGWLGIAMPEEFGGGGRGITEAAVVPKEVAASGAAMNGCSALHINMFGLNPVALFGNDRLRSEVPLQGGGRPERRVRPHRARRRHGHVTHQHPGGAGREGRVCPGGPQGLDVQGA